MEGEARGDHETASEAVSYVLVRDVMVFQGANDEDISLVEVEEATQCKGGVIHCAADEGKVLHGGQKEVHVVGILNELDRGEA